MKKLSIKIWSGTEIPASCDQSAGKKCCSADNVCTSDCNCVNLGCVDYDVRKFFRITSLIIKFLTWMTTSISSKAQKKPVFEQSDLF